MDAAATAAHHAPVRVLTHIKRLDDCFGDFLVRVVYESAPAVRFSRKPSPAWSAGR
jgi:hypothetical protein